MGLSWDDAELAVKNEPRWRADRRRLQSWWRHAVLRAEPGPPTVGKQPLVGSMLTAADVERQPRLNFLSESAYTHAEQRKDEVLREGGTLEVTRLYRNLLSSMPMCFNLFGALRTSPQFIRLLRGAFGVECQTIDSVVCEWAPPDRAGYLNDRTAFDAAVRYIDGSGRRCILGVEVKYTEPFSAREYCTSKYRDVTQRSGWFKDGAADGLRRRKSNQLWRNAMLAASMELAGDVDHGSIVVLCLGGDAGARTAVGALHGGLVDPSRVRQVALEDVVASARGDAALRTWADLFSRRYLEPTAGDAGPTPFGPAPQWDFRLPTTLAASRRSVSEP